PNRSNDFIDEFPLNFRGNLKMTLWIVAAQIVAVQEAEAGDAVKASSMQDDAASGDLSKPRSIE
ncbi:MAG: hypothetical protein R3236_12010, partial [Phycisphaeraceae bacterium]|nr:hypothetical protein [Phycisphaeraceae bacterium]